MLKCWLLLICLRLLRCRVDSAGEQTWELHGCRRHRLLMLQVLLVQLVERLLVESLGFGGGAGGPLVGLRGKIYDSASYLHSFVIEGQQRSSLFDEN